MAEETRVDWTLHEGDCLEVMRELPSESVDMVLCDPPYGTTACSWDSVIPLEPLWNEYRRLIKPHGAIVLTASQPFTSLLITSNLSMFKYCWVWRKSRAMGYLQANYRPLKAHEDICVFSRGNATPKATNIMRYNPQGLIEQPSRKVRRSGMGIGSDRKSQIGEYVSRGTNYPRSVLDFPSEPNPVHPTQKPVPLFSYLIRTYTNPGDMVLDNCAGSGTTGVAAVENGRNVIMIEREPEYCEIIRRRMSALTVPLPLAY